MITLLSFQKHSEAMFAAGALDNMPSKKIRLSDSDDDVSTTVPSEDADPLLWSGGVDDASSDVDQSLPWSDGIKSDTSFRTRV